MSVWFQLAPILGIGIVGAILTLSAIYVAAFRWKRRSGFAYSLSCLLFYSLLFLATFQHSVLNADPRPIDLEFGAALLLLLGQAAFSAAGVAGFSVVLFGAYLALLPRLDRPVDRVKSQAGCAVFCILAAAFFNPGAAVKKLIDTDDPSASIYAAGLAAVESERAVAAIRRATETLDKLMALGVITRIEKTEQAVTHFVAASFLDLPNDVVEEYARAALVHHIHKEYGAPKPVVLRETGTGRQIAIRERDGRFRRF